MRDMVQRRIWLKLAVIILLAGNVFFFATHDSFWGTSATISYVGLDSLDMVMPNDHPATALLAGKWTSDPAVGPATISVTNSEGHIGKMVLVTLAPEPSYGKFIEVVRALKAKGICNVFIRESGIDSGARVRFADGERSASKIPSIVLCGRPMGDAGFYGALPPDKKIRI